MTLKLHPDKHLPAAYTYLRSVEPFCRMKLPEADDVRFAVTREAAVRGWFRTVDGQPEIGISEKCVGSTNYLMQTMAHEQIHMLQWMDKKPQTHNAYFKRLAQRVCKAHGFVYLEFI